MLDANLKHLILGFDFLVKGFDLIVDLFIDFEFNIKIEFLGLFGGVMIVFIHLKAMNE